MKLGLINSAWVQAGKGTAWGIQKTREIGFDSIDIFADPLDLTPSERSLIRTECAANALPVISVACVSVGLIDFNPSVRRFHNQRCRAYLDFVQELEAENLLLVLGEYIWDRQVIPQAEQWKYAVEELQNLGMAAAERGVKIALELEPFPLSMLNSVHAMVRFLEEVHHPAVGANIDISHLYLARCAPEELRRFQGRAFHVHISDCDGQVHGDLPPGRGVVDFAPYLREIAQLQMPGAISLELEYSPEPDRIEEWVREAYDTTTSLMQSAGLHRE